MRKSIGILIGTCVLLVLGAAKVREHILEAPAGIAELCDRPLRSLREPAGLLDQQLLIAGTAGSDSNSIRLM